MTHEEGANMKIIDLLSPKPLDPYARDTYETKMFYVVSDALHRVGIHGDDNTIETCRALGIKDCCDKISTETEKVMAHEEAVNIIRKEYECRVSNSCNFECNACEFFVNQDTLTKAMRVIKENWT